MKNKFFVIVLALMFSTLVTVIFATLAVWTMYLGGVFQQKYSNADFGIATVVSDHDEDADGIDDQTDILLSAREYIATNPKYQSRYYAGGYPDDEYGVCTDVIAFALLGAGYDLRELVDADIRANPEQYNIEIVDKNIDFRRVPNLKIFFDNHAEILTNDIYEIGEWQGGDIVVFDGHIGIVSDARNRHGVPFVIHHYSPWQQTYEEDILERRHDIVGHYRFRAEENPQLFSKYLRRADELLAEMSIEEKVAQMFLVRFPETSQLAGIAAAEPGGFILFAKDFQGETPTSVRQKLQNLQDASKINFIFSVDEEGGIVTRVSRYPAFRSERFAAPGELYRQGGIDLIVQDAHEKSALLKSLGINMNLAPVADMPTDEDSFIYDRSLGQEVAETARYVGAVVMAMNEDKMISSMKHFPGYGDNVDTHIGVAIDKRSYDSLAAADFLPFVSGIEAGGPTILVSHNIIEAIDADRPASLSKAVHDILRKQLGFSGVIVTDDLAMGAVQSYAAKGEAAVDAVLAGNDLIITSDFLSQKVEVLNAVEQGAISEELINTAVRRVLAMKIAYGIVK